MMRTAFLLVLILAAVIQLPAIGVSTDEIFQRDHRLVNARAYYSLFGVLNRAPATVSEPIFLNEYQFKYYGVGVQYPLILLEYFPEQISPERPLYWIISHGYTHAFFLGSILAFWGILRLIGASERLTLLGTLLYGLHPRIYGPSFYNIKDVMFLSLLTIGAWAVLRAWRNNSWQGWLLAGSVTALAINSRVMGLMLVGLVGGLWIFEYLRSRQTLNSLVKSFLSFIVGCCATLYLIWPVLWTNPIRELYNALVVFGNYLEWDNVIVFRGEVLSGVSPPLDYVMTWITITSPTGYLIGWGMGLVGLMFFGVRFWLDRSKPPPPLAIIASLAIGALAGVQALLWIADSTMYNAWRHTSFLHLPLSLIAIFGFWFVWQSRVKWVKALVFAGLALSLGSQLEWMGRHAPHHQLYFNRMMVKDPSRWDRDYWQLTAKHVIEDLIRTNRTQQMLVFHENLPTLLAFKTIPDDLLARSRIDGALPNVHLLLMDYDGVVGEIMESPLVGFELFRTYRLDDISAVAVFAQTHRASFMR